MDEAGRPLSAFGEGCPDPESAGVTSEDAAGGSDWEGHSNLNTKSRKLCADASKYPTEVTSAGRVVPRLEGGVGELEKCNESPLT